jgi:hypothetical protein
MDECDTAAKVMECGKNAAPDIFEDIVNTVDLNAVVRFFYMFHLLNLDEINRMKSHCLEPGQNVSPITVASWRLKPINARIIVS